MKNLTALFTLVIFSFCAKGQQNLVPNPSFEDTIGCPVTAGSITSKCANWIQYNSADYFHACSNNLGVPFNAFGFQNALNGNAYVGIRAHAASPSLEYIGCKISPLIAGGKYEATMHVNKANMAELATNNLGIFFWSVGIDPNSYNTFHQYVPQVSFAQYGVITDSINWIKLTKTFISDSNYSNIIIGGFNTNSNSYVIDTLWGNGTSISYYYVDSVNIKRLDPLYTDILDTLLCAGDTVKISYITNIKYASNNIFTIQLSDDTGSFTNAINIGSVTSDTSGDITCIVPLNIATGVGYRVRILATNIADTSIDNGYDIKIGNPITSAISTGSNAPVCEAENINFYASTNIANALYYWSGPNGYNITSQNPVLYGVIPANSGIYYATIKFYGCEVTDTVSVSIKPLPANMTVTSNSTLCATDTIKLTASSTSSNVTWSWTGPNSYTSSLQNPMISSSTTNMSGTYTATAILDGCSSSATTSVTVKPMPTAVTASSNTPVCAGSNLLVSIGASTTGSTYSWTGPNSFSSSNLSNTITAATTAATGWYVATVDLNGCGFKDSIYATVNPIPTTPTISFNSPLCLGETLNLNGGSISGGSYNWTGPNGFSSTQNNPARSNMQWADTGVYKTTVSVNNCPSAEAQTRVTLNPVPFVTIFSNPMDTICSGQAVTFVALPNNHAGTPLYQWHVNNSLVSTGTTFNTNSLNNQDVVRCDMTEYTKCSLPYKDESNDITMTVMPWLAPSVSITANPTTPLKPDEFITFTAKPVDAGTIPKFQWKRNGQDVVGATGAIWSANTLNDNDDICVELTSTYRCPQQLTANSNCIKVRVLTGVDDINGNNKWTVHPNPNNGRFIITAKDIYSTEARFEVVNAVGQVVFRDVVFPQQGSISKEVNLNDVAKGIYLLRIYAGDETMVFKLVIE